MKPQWHFNTQRLCDRTRDPNNDAFFTAESLDNLSEALVREGIQNSLDAAERTEENVRQVRIRIRYEPRASTEARKYLSDMFNTAKVHFERGLSVKHLAQLFEKDCGYLLFEDFGTRGLSGDVEECRYERAAQNGFFSFFRAEGLSSKSLGSLGRWGIGKQVFPTSSRLHAMFGLTVRRDTPSRVLMGSAVVRTHTIEDQAFQPDAWFGIRNSAENPVAPITDRSYLDTFSKTFGLERTNENGLSVVVPSVDERVNIEDLRRGIVKSFFWPILQGELVIDLEMPEKRWRIDAETLPAHREVLPANEAAVLEFAGWASTAKPSDFVVLSDDRVARPDWRSQASSLLADRKLEEIRARLHKNSRVGVRIPILIRPKYDGGKESGTSFMVFLESCRESGCRTIFLRDGIVITDVRSPLVSGFRSIVVIEKAGERCPLAGLLGDSEGVNHTQWQKDSPKFHNRYVYGPDTIKFVSRSAFEITQKIHSEETEGDPDLLSHVFSLPGEDEAEQKRKKPLPNSVDSVVDQPQDFPPVSAKRFVLESVKGGFVVKPGRAPLEQLPVRIQLESAYALRKGNPFSKWTSEDFVFMRSPIRCDQVKSVFVLKADNNLLEIEIRAADFQFSVTGFDTRRDLVVRATEIRQSNETDI